jgi:hypothetical protein
MKKMLLLAFLLPITSTLPGRRAKPARIFKFAGPSSEVFYTVEVWEDNGAISSDFTKVFAHLEHNGNSDKVLFLDGAYLAVAAVRWNGRNEATICLSEGSVNSFRQDISLRAGGETYEIRNHVHQNCPK